MVVKRIIPEKQRKELEKKNSEHEKKIQAKIRKMAIESLKAEGKLPADYI